MSIKPSQVITISNRSETSDNLDDYPCEDEKSIHKSRSGKESHKTYPFYYEKREFSREKSRSNSRDASKRNFSGHKIDSRKAFSSKTTPENSPSRGNKHSYKTEGYASSNGLMTNSKESRLLIYKHSHDESRFARLLSKLERDDERDKPLPIFRQLKEILFQPENFKLATQHYSELTRSFENYLQNRNQPDIQKELILCIVALGTALDGDCKNYFDWLFSFLANNSSVQVRIAVFQIILEVLRQDEESSKLADFIPMINNQAQTALENVETHEGLMAVVEVILHIARVQPSTFSSNFRDTVDILVGWHIDSSPNLPHVGEISRALVALHDFWVIDIGFTVTLMMQFLEDMDSYGEELASIPSPDGSEEEIEDQHKIDESLSKIDGLIRVFSTVLKSLGRDGCPAENPGVSWEFIVRGLKGLFKCMNIVVHWSYEESLLTSAHECAALLLTNAQNQGNKALTVMVNYLTRLLDHCPSSLSTPHLISILNLLQTFVREVGSHIPTSFINQLFSTSSLVHKLKLMPTPKISQGVIQLYHAALGLKNVPILEETYKAILQDLQAAGTFLLSNENFVLSEDATLFPKYEDKEVAKVAFLSNLGILSELATIKHSLIGMWALKPSLFDLLSQHLQPFLTTLIVEYPEVHYALLYTFYSHCSRHGHFISSSSLINTVSSPQFLSAPPITRPTSKHFAKEMVFLTAILSKKDLSHNSRYLLLSWTLELMEALQYNTNKLCNKMEFLGLAQALVDHCFSTDAVLCKTSCAALQSLLKYASTSLPAKFLDRCYEACIIKFSDSNPSIRSSFFSLFTFFPLDIITSNTSLIINSTRDVTFPKEECIDQEIWMARHHYLNRPPTPTFEGNAFKIITSFILAGNKPKNENWALQLYYSCTTNGSNSSSGVRGSSSSSLANTEETMRRLLPHSQSLGTFWATWEVAQYCVLQKLRTPLGKPQDTFTTIEGAIKNYAKNIFLPSKKISKEEKLEEIKRIRMLLDLTEHLEKLMYNAYEGTAIALYTPPKAVRTFFRTNKGTCLEWVSRIRMAIILVALKTGQMANVVRQGFQLLNEMAENNQAQSPDFEHLLIYVIQALKELGSSESILGLYIWARDHVGQKFTWIKAAVDHASGRFENAAHEYTCVLHSLVQDEDSVSHASQDSLKEHSIDSSFLKLNNDSGISHGKNILRQETNSTTDIQVQGYLMHQVMECYLKLGNYSEALHWAELEQEFCNKQNGHHHFYNADELDYLKSLSSFESYQKTSKLEVRDPSAECSSWDSIMIQEEMTVLKKVAKVLNSGKPNYEEIRDFSETMRSSNLHLQEVLKASCNDWPPSIDPTHAAFFLATNSFANIYQKGKKVLPTLLKDGLKLEPTDSNCTIMNHALFWSTTWQLLQYREHRSHLGPYADLQLVAARLARKQQNIQLAQKLLHKCVNVIAGLHRSNGILSPTNTSSPLSSLKDTLLATTHLSASDRLVCLHREGSKLLHCCGEIQGSIDLLLSSISSILTSGGNETKSSNGKTSSEQTSLCQLNAKSLLTLTKYLQQDGHYLNTLLKNENTNNPNQVAALQALLSLASVEIDTYNRTALEPLFEDSANIPEGEHCLSLLFQAAVTQAPNLAKPWLALASWSYRWGRKAVDAAGSAGLVELSKDTQEEILRIVPRELSETERQNLFHAIAQASSSDADWNEANMCMPFEGENAPTISHLLTTCPWLEQEAGSPELIHRLLEVRRKVLQSTYRYYEVAAKAYFRFLQISSQSEDEKHDDDNVTATLRLLRIIVKHASELRTTLEKGLAHTPTAPWRGIIPQLFSRLNHPELYVRQSISDLLCRVAQASPHLIVFPAVVGSLTLSTHDRFQDTSSGLLKSCLGKKESEGGVIGSTQHSEDDEVDPSTDEEDTAQQQQRQAMQNCFAALVATLGNHDARTISQVKVLVQELRRITLLWDELWLGTLTLHHSDTHRRINTLEEEIRKVQANSSLKPEEKTQLIKDKHYVFVKPLVFILEQLQSITSQTPETPHEQRFQDVFSKQITETLEKIRNPDDPTKPHHVWTLYKQLHQKLQHECGGTGGNRGQLLMEEISPKLANLQDTEIPMPGAGGAGVRIQAIHPTVSVLPTKTKPKKLAFLGSDGRKYTFLFKGLEDLHLDQRIMQFLAIVNDMLAKNRKNGKGVTYRARHYSVTPLGPRSGLIQWVDRATPLFGLYKRWQQRESAAQMLKPSQNTTGGALPAPILRPSEIYYNKLSPLLKEKGINNLENRKEWPLSVQLQVLRELMEETPKDLLAKELWCSSTTPLEWWQVSQTYCRSTAVMSVIGYIIGLGDRHLDNLLVDLTTGEMIHIDYNVCFEKGKNLRVPEKVPFRMTPNIETALGLTGVEGLFRVSCEAVLRVMRRGRESLMTLLEAFVYDPLVEWTPGGVEGGYPGAAYGGTHPCRGARQAMERDLVCRLFTIRLAEMRAAWLHNKSELVSTMSQLQKEIENWQASKVELHSAERELQEVCHQKALLDEALANPSHPLFSLPKRYKEFVRIKTSLLTAEEAITEKINECAKWQNHHLEALENVCGPKLGHWLQEVTKYSNHPPDTFTVAPAVEFLHNSGKGQLVQQCETAENELNSALHEVHLGIRTCVETLSRYALIVMQFPPSFRQQNRSVTWQLLLTSLLGEFTERKCMEIEALLQSNCGQETLALGPVHTAFNIYITLKNIIGDLNNQLIATIDYQHREGLVDVPLITSMSNEAKANVIHFIRENGAAPAVCMGASLLTTSLKRLLHLDKSMSNALGDVDRLGGDSSFEEMCSLIHLLHQHLKLLQDSIPDLSPQAKTAFHPVTCAYNVFSSLEELSLNFQNIILPETLKGIQAEDPSVAQMIERVNALVGPPGQVSTLISNLEEDIRKTVMDLQTPRSEALRKVNEIRKELNDLLQGNDPQMLGLSSGQMLLMGFNGLFTKLDSDMAALLRALDILQPPTSWKKVDLFCEALLFLPSALWVESTRELIGGIFLLRRLTAMQGVFAECCQMAGLLRLSPSCFPATNDPEHLSDYVLAGDGGCKPIKAFMYYYLYKQLLGVFVQASISCLCSLLVEVIGLDLEAEITCCGAEPRITMDDLVKRAADLYCCHSTGRCDTTALLSEIGSRFALLDTALKKEEAARRGEQNIQVLKATLHRKQIQLAQFQWLFEDYLVPNCPGVISPRTTIMSEMRKNMQTLLALENHANSNLQKFLTLTASVEQRIKWASGANPTLVETREKFEAAISEKTASTNSLLSTAKELCNTSNALLHFEALRTYTTEARSSEAALVAIIKKCREACRQAENCAPSVSSVEEKLLSLLPVGDADELTMEMLSDVTDKVSLASCKDKLEEQKLNCYTHWDSAKKSVTILRNLLTEHHTLMSDIRNILRNLSKYEEQGNGGEMGPIQQFLVLYKNFSENISGLVREVLSESTESLDLEALRAQLPALSSALSQVFDTLLQLAHEPALTTHSDKVAGGEPISGNTALHSNAPGGGTTLARDPRTGKIVQERNTYATNVLKRVKHKLEGRDPDSNKKSSIAEQVDFIIKEATNLENLAVLYEGWTPWV